MLTAAQFQVSLCSEDINRSGAQRCLKKEKKRNNKAARRPWGRPRHAVSELGESIEL